MFELNDVLVFCLAYAGLVMAGWIHTLTPAPVPAKKQSRLN